MCWNRTTKTELKTWLNDLGSCTDRSEQLLDQKGYMFVSNFTDSAYVWDSFKLFIAATINLLAQIKCSVKGRYEESSPSDASIPKERGKIRTCLWACPLTPTPRPHHPSPCLCKINMRGSSKVAWIDAIRTTRYPVILMLCCGVFIFVVKQGVPSNEDLEWLYSSCLLYGKESFRAFRSIAKLRYKW